MEYSRTSELRKDAVEDAEDPAFQVSKKLDVGDISIIPISSTIRDLTLSLFISGIIWLHFCMKNLFKE